jgi:hypothetical protein
VESFLIIGLIHFPFCSLICTAIDFSCACLHSSLFEKMLGQKILKIFIRPPTYKCLQVPFDSIYNLPCFIPIQKNRLDITSKNSQLCSNRYLPSLPHLIKLNKSCICLLNPYFYIFPAPRVLVTTLPRYEDLFTSSFSFSFILIFCHFLH